MKKERIREEMKQNSSPRTKQYELLKEIVKKSSARIAGQKQRVRHILGTGKRGLPGVSEQTILRYREFLKQNLDVSDLVTGREFFEWEEYFIIGPGSESEYEELKKQQPSYKDHSKIVKIYEDRFHDFRGVLVRVQRISDRKRFNLPLADLEALTRAARTRISWTITHSGL